MNFWEMTVHDIAEELITWLNDERDFALAIVVDTWSSAPRPVGSMMLTDTAGHVVGGLSGGCVEADVIAHAEQAIRAGTAQRLHYGVADKDAMQVGLPCGGHIDVLVVPCHQENKDVLRRVATNVRQDSSVSLAVITASEDANRLGTLIAVDRDGPLGASESERLTHAITDDAYGKLITGRTGVVSYGPEGERLGSGLDVLVVTHAPRPRMIIFGAIDHARALTRAARFVGHHVTICDARSMFATRARFPEADSIIVDWPHRYLEKEIENGEIDERTVLIDLTHDLKFDIPLLRVALAPRCQARFVGAMGSRRTNESRRSHLLNGGMPSEQWDRLHTPVGLDIGARTPEATAISILAETIADQWNGSGIPLRDFDGPIHHD